MMNAPDALVIEKLTGFILLALFDIVKSLLFSKFGKRRLGPNKISNLSANYFAPIK